MFTMRHVQAFILSALVIVMAGVTTYWIKSKALEKQQRLEVLQSRIESFIFGVTHPKINIVIAHRITEK